MLFYLESTILTCCSRNLVSPRSSIHLLPCQTLLGPNRRWPLHDLRSKMVQRCIRKHPHRSHPAESTHAISQRPQSSQTSKGRSDRRLCSRWLVSFLLAAHTICFGTNTVIVVSVSYPWPASDLSMSSQPQTTFPKATAQQPGSRAWK